MEAGTLVLSYSAQPPPYGSIVSIAEKTWSLFLLMRHSFSIICKMEEKSQACFSNEKPPPSLFPVQLQSNAISRVL